MKFLVTCWACLLLVLAVTEGNEHRGPPQRHQSLSDSIRLLDVTRGVLRKITKISFLSRFSYVEWIQQKLDTVYLYVTAGQTLAAKLDPGLLDALTGVAGRAEREERRSTMNDYVLNWRYKPAAIPAYIRKKSKLSNDVEEEIDEDFSASHSNDRGYYGGGGGGHGGGSYGGGGHGGGGYGGGGYGGGGR